MTTAVFQSLLLVCFSNHILSYFFHSFRWCPLWTRYLCALWSYHWWWTQVIFSPLFWFQPQSDIYFTIISHDLITWFSHVYWVSALISFFNEILDEQFSNKIIIKSPYHSAYRIILWDICSIGAFSLLFSQASSILFLNWNLASTLYATFQSNSPTRNPSITMKSTIAIMNAIFCCLILQAGIY